jgi:hypothetical protein
MNQALLSQLNRFQVTSLLVGTVGVILCVVGAIASTAQFYISYLFGYLFWLGLALGCFGVAMIHYLTGGRWGNETRRFLEAGFMTLPLMALLFIPFFFGVQHLYPWARAADVAANKVLQSRAAYSNLTMFAVRAVFVFAIWIVMARLLRKWSLEQDQTEEVKPTRRMRTLSGPGMIIYPLTATLAFVDWIMSAEPDWYSTMFPVIICISQILTAYAFIIIALNYFKNYEPMSEMALTTPFHHLGNLLLAFVIFWTYVAFGQLLIVWSGNLPHEIVWYLHRIAGGWKWIVAFLGLFHFFVPFFVLLFRAAKRRGATLAAIAGMVFVAQIVDSYWFVTPSFHQSGVHVSWLDFAALFGVGGFWTAMFIFALKRAALLPQNDPRIRYPFAHAK